MIVTIPQDQCDAAKAIIKAHSDAGMHAINWTQLFTDLNAAAPAIMALLRDLGFPV